MHQLCVGVFIYFFIYWISQLFDTKYEYFFFYLFRLYVLKGTLMGTC